MPQRMEGKIRHCPPTLNGSPRFSPHDPGLVHNGCEATAQAVFAAASLSGNARCVSSSPAQILLDHPSVKKQRPRQRRNVVQEVSDACPSWRDSGHSKGYLHFLCFPTETAERSPRKNAETSPIRRSRARPQSLFRCRSFSERPIEKPEKAGWEIHPVMKLTVSAYSNPSTSLTHENVGDSK